MLPISYNRDPQSYDLNSILLGPNQPDVEQEPIESCESRLLNDVYHIALNTVSGFLAGYLFGIINPIGGAVFSVTSATAATAIRLLSEQMGFSSTTAKVIVLGLSTIVGIGIAALTTTAAGFPITFAAGVGMSLAMVGTSIVISIASKGAFCCLAVIGGAALAMQVQE